MSAYPSRRIPHPDHNRNSQHIAWHLPFLKVMLLSKVMLNFLESDLKIEITLKTSEMDSFPGLLWSIITLSHSEIE